MDDQPTARAKARRTTPATAQGHGARTREKNDSGLTRRSAKLACVHAWWSFLKRFRLRRARARNPTAFRGGLSLPVVRSDSRCSAKLFFCLNDVARSSTLRELLTPSLRLGTLQRRSIQASASATEARTLTNSPIASTSSRPVPLTTPGHAMPGQAFYRHTPTYTGHLTLRSSPASTQSTPRKAAARSHMHAVDITRHPPQQQTNKHTKQSAQQQ